MNAGDEILLLNGKPASALQMDDMRAAFVNQALTLSVSTLPQLDPRVLCSQPPRRSDAEHDPATDIFSQNQGKISRSVLLFLFSLKQSKFHQMIQTVSSSDKPVSASDCNLSNQVKVWRVKLLFINLPTAYFLTYIQ